MDKYPPWKPPTSYITVYNTTGEDVPPYGVMSLTSQMNGGIYNIAKPTEDNLTGNIAFAGSSPILNNSYGQAVNSYPAVAAFQLDSDDQALPQVNDIWGVKINSWYLSRFAVGFIIQRAPLTDVTGETFVLIERAPSSMVELVQVINPNKQGPFVLGQRVHYDTRNNKMIPLEQVWIVDPNNN